MEGLSFIELQQKMIDDLKNGITITKMDSRTAYHTKWCNHL
jgi:hypothetical protein